MPDFNVIYTGTPVIGNVSTNDLVPAGTTYGTPTAGTENPEGATIKMNADGTYTFNAEKSGVYSYEVPVCTIDGVCTTITLTITVKERGAPEAPIVKPDLGSTRAGRPVVVNTLVNDAVGRPRVVLVPGSVKVIEQPKNGTVIVDPLTGNITYTPSLGFVGKDSYTYTVCDSGSPALCSTAIQEVNVLPNNTRNLAMAADDFVRTVSSTPASGNVLVNDSNLDDNKLTVTPQRTETAEGVFVLNEDGTFSFTQALGFVGPVQFVYSVCDNGSPQACARATVYLLVAPNDLVAEIDNFQENEVNGLAGGIAGNVLANDQMNDKPVGASEVRIKVKNDGGMNGVSIDQNGNLIVPKGTAAGSYIITYTICDIQDPTNCDEAIAIVEVFHGVNLRITKVADVEEWFEGDQFGFTLTVENNGQTDAKGVRVSDLLPEGLRYVASTVVGATAETSVNGQEITWSVLSLPAGSSFQVRILVKAAPLDGGKERMLVNTASVGSLERELTESDNRSSAEVKIKLFFIPNTISPNGDRVNDTFEIPGLGRYTTNELLIFNRWGDHVYERTNYQNDWGAEGLVSGTYFYLLKVTDEGGKSIEFKGFIQVVKERIR